MQILKFYDCYREDYLAIFIDFTSLDLINYLGILKIFLGCALGCFQSKTCIVKSICKLKGAYVSVKFYVSSFLVRDALLFKK